MCLPSEVKGSTIQRIATIIGTLLCINTGVMFGISPSHAELYQQRDKTPLNRPIDDAAATWVISYLFLGATFSALFSGCISNRIGPKSVLLLSGLLQLAGWFCIHFGFDIMHIYASRLFGGIAAGAAFTALPLFIAEITDDSSDRLIVKIEQARALGIFTGFMLGQYMPYMYVAIIGVVMSSIFSLTFPFVQESPYFYLRKGNMPGFEKSLRWYRGIRNIDDREQPEFIREMNALKIAETKPETTFSKFKSHRYVLKLFVLCLLTSLCAHCTGVYVVFSNTLQFLPEKPLTKEFPAHATDATWLLAGAHYLGAWLSAYVLISMKRKLCFILAGFTCALALIGLALCQLLATTLQLNESQYYSLIFSLLAINVLVSNVALFPLIPIIAVEILPQKVRAIVISIIFSFCWMLSFLLIHYYRSLVWLLTLSGYWCFLGACSISFTILCLLFLPETRDKSIEELENHLGYGLHDEVPKISTISNGHMNEAFE